MTFVSNCWVGRIDFVRIKVNESSIMFSWFSGICLTWMVKFLGKRDLAVIIHAFAAYWSVFMHARALDTSHSSSEQIFFMTAAIICTFGTWNLILIGFWYDKLRFFPNDKRVVRTPFWDFSEFARGFIMKID